MGLTRLHLSVGVLPGGICGTGLANAIFVDGMTLDDNRSLKGKVDPLPAEIRRLRTELRT